MKNRRRFANLVGATALSDVSAPALIRRSFAQGTAAPVARGHYLIKNGAVITVDPLRGVLPRADIHVRDGRIEAIGPDLQIAGAEIIDATDMIVMPGFVDTHHHMWSALGRNFIRDGLGYFQAKAATSSLFQPDDFYNSVMLGLVEMANAGITTVPTGRTTRARPHMPTQSCGPSRVDARPLRLRPHRRDAAQSIARLHRYRPRSEYFAAGSAFDGLVTFGSICAASRER
jgi:hypothetical protein